MCRISAGIHPLRPRRDKDRTQHVEEGLMAARGRNQVCQCGSGRKVKRCCGQRRGPGEADLARAFLASQAAASAFVLSRCSHQELHRLHDEMMELPERHGALQLGLPRLMTPEVQRLIDAIVDEDLDEVDDALPAVLRRVDTPMARVELARAVIALREAGEIGAKVAAFTLAELAAPSLDAFVASALVHAAGVAAGQLRSPSGLLVASSL